MDGKLCLNINNNPGEEMIPELFYHIGSSSLSFSVTEEIK